MLGPFHEHGGWRIKGRRLAFAVSGEPGERTYRADIDGLRAVAVLAVIAFHASTRFLRGGFVGVDVFFVISGFLITGIVCGQIAEGTFSFGDFYARRIRRIFPALICVLIGCWAFGWFALTGDEYEQLVKHIAAGAGFVSNLVLWRESGYFDVPSASKPLLHLWSLGIEEQFYLVWPPALYLCWRKGLNILTVTVAVILLSFTLNVRLIDHDAVSAFYLPAPRLWELLVGGLLAYADRFRRTTVDRWTDSILFVSTDRADPRFVANLTATLGAALIATAMLALGRETPYPGWWAVVPVAGTALLLWAGPDAFVNRAVLARRGLVYLGLMSYPLYLWHWPLLAFVGLTESGRPSVLIRILAVGLSFVLAWLTYRFVEQPIRMRASVRTPFRIAAIALLLAIIAGGSLWSFTTGTPGPRSAKLAIGLPERLRASSRDPLCRQRFQTQGDYCQEYAVNLPVTTALIGDSHAERMFDGLGAYLAGRSENVVLLGQSGCPPLLGIETTRAGERNTCSDENASILDVVGNRSDLTRVVLAFRGAFEVTGYYRLAGTTLGPVESMQRALQATVDFLIARHKSVWLIQQVPEIGFSISECVGRPFSFEHKGRTPCAVPRADVAAQQAAFRRVVDEVQRRTPSLKTFDPLPFLCDDLWCYAVKNGKVLYSDHHHLSPDGSMFLADKFRLD